MHCSSTTYDGLGEQYRKAKHMYIEKGDQDTATKLFTQKSTILILFCTSSGKSSLLTMPMSTQSPRKKKARSCA